MGGPHIPDDAYELALPLKPGSCGWRETERHIQEGDELDAAVLVLTPTRACIEVVVAHDVVEEDGNHAQRRFSDRIRLEPARRYFWLSALIGDMPALRYCVQFLWPGEVEKATWLHLL